MASIQELPDEIILKVIKSLNIKDLVKFGHVSKRMRKIRSDESLWQKINLSQCTPGRGGCYIDVPTDLVKMAIENECKYLSLYNMKLGPIFMGSEGDLRLDKSSSLIYLDLKYCEANVKTFEEILASCHSLQKLSMASKGQAKSWWVRPCLTSNMIRSIWYQNGHTLQTLNLRFCSGLDLESIQKITKNCVELKNIDFASTELSKDSINFLVNNLTLKVEKIDLGCHLNFEDEELKALVTRCNKLSVLNLLNTSITNDSLTHIVENLQQTLEELDVYLCDDVTYAKLTTLKSMPKLKNLNFSGSNQEEKDLKKLMPFVRCGEIITADERKQSSADGIWDVEAKQHEFFKKLEKCQYDDDD
jgi:hypothetical protein